MRYFDLHCDTASAIFYGNQSLKSNGFHVSLDKAAAYEKYIQLSAVFTNPDLSDEEGWEEFFKIRENLIRECKENGIAIISDTSSLEEFINNDKKCAFILTVEDARILGGKIERVKTLYDSGVRVITPLWGGSTCIGGSHDTDEGLTDFGKAAVKEMVKIGIIPDISHASFNSADDIMDICEKYGASPIATHMNSYGVCAHSRNLTDERYLRLTKLGGIAGISLCLPHLQYGIKRGETVPISKIAEHFQKYEELSSSRCCFGCDFDGVGNLPEGINGADGIPKIAEYLSENGFSKTEVENILFNTPYEFMKKNLR